MAKKNENRVSVNKFETVMKEEFENTVNVEWHGVDLVVKKTISLADMLAFVEECAQSCFLEDGSFVPELKEFAIRCNVLVRYAGFALPSDAEKKYKLVYGTDAYLTVLEHIDVMQFSDIENAVEERIRFEVAGANREMRRKLDDAVGAFENMAQQLDGLFGNLTNDDIKSMLEVATKGVDEKKVALAVLDAQKDDKVIEI